LKTPLTSPPFVQITLKKKGRRKKRGRNGAGRAANKVKCREKKGKKRD